MAFGKQGSHKSAPMAKAHETGKSGGKVVGGGGVKKAMPVKKIGAGGKKPH